MLHRPQRGFTLVELMIALLLGTLLTAAVLSVFMQSKRSSNQNNGIARMQENARFAMQIMREELQHADFFADLAAVGESLVIDSSVGTPTGCSGSLSSPWLTELTDLSDRLEYSVGVADASAAKTLYSCITPFTDTTGTTTINFKPNTNILAIKRLRGIRDVTLTQGKMYLRSNGAQGTLYYMSGTTPPSIYAGEASSDWEYTASIFYLGDDNVLYREYLSDGMVMQREALIDDVEYFHVQFGIDADNYTELDGIPNYYTSTPDLDPDTGNMKYAVTARIYLLMRATQLDPSYTNDTIYTLGDPAADGININEQLLGSAGATFNDPIRRRVYTTTVRLENIRSHFTLGN